MEKRNRKYHILYAVMIGLFFAAVLWLAVSYKGPSMRGELTEHEMDFSVGWQAFDGSEADLEHLNDMPSVEPYRQAGVFHVLPDSLPEGMSLCFRSKNIYYQVYVDGELRYEPYVPESSLYNNSLGTRWNFIPLYGQDAGKKVEVRFYTVYDSARACIDYLYIGNPGGVMLTVFSGKSVAIVTCILLLFVGLMLIVADIPINMQSQKNHELLYLGLFALSIAIWCTSETNLLQFFTGDSRLLQFLSCCSLILIPIPMVLYLDAAFGFRSRIFVPLVCIMSGMEFFICTALHFLKIMDYHETLTVSHIVLAISAAILFGTIIHNSFRMGKSRIRNIYKVLRVIGLTSIAFATGIDIWRYYVGNGGDSAMFVRIGLLLFVVCYGSSSLEKTINAVKLGVQTEFVSQLAYRDGLTGIGNRTAFQERLVELEEIKDTVEAVGIIMFDVNDLKYVNDNMGHQQGDAMLVQSAELIKSVFEAEDCRCFRIGGDEFSAILYGERIKERCQQELVSFTKAMEEFNSEPGHDFRISIAAGFAIYNQECRGKMLMEVYQQADAAMYENKKEIKKRRALQC